MRSFFLLLPAVLLSACAGATPIPAPAQLHIYASPAAQPWLSQAFTCAAGRNILLNVSVSPDQADLVIRLGEPAALLSPAYQIDTEEILIAANRESSLQSLTLEQARLIFAGQGDASAELWVYAPDEDIQQAFDDLVMHGSVLSSQARLAVSPQQMSASLSAQPSAVGILPRRWVTGELRELFSAGSVPVLAITPSEPLGPLKDLLACLQE